MNCPEARLEEYFDGELGPDERREVEAHLGVCAACRGEVEELRQLEGLLRRVPAAGRSPDADRFLEGVRRHSRPRRAWFAAAAAVLLGVVSVTLVARPRVNVREELGRYAQSPSDAVEERIRSAGTRAVEVLRASADAKGPDRLAAAALLLRLGGEADRSRGLDVLQSGLDDRDVRTQFAAASFLFRAADAPTRDRVLARFQQRREPNGGWALLEPGADEEDVEMVPAAVSMALEGQEGWALGVLRKLHRLNERAQGRIVESVVTLLMSDNPRVQKLALAIVKELEIEFPLSAVVELLDSPELGDEALKILRKASGKDLGKDKEAWKKALSPRKEGV